MSTISDKERYLIARGDVAIVALKAVLNILEPTRDTNERTATQLQAVQAKQPQGNVTLLSIVTQVATQTSLSLTSATETIKLYMRLTTSRVRPSRKILRAPLFQT